MYVIKYCGKKMAKRLFQNYWYETILKWKQKKKSSSYRNKSVFEDDK